MRVIPLSRVDRKTGGETREPRYALVDDEDFGELVQYKWWGWTTKSTGKIYATRTEMVQPTAEENYAYYFKGGPEVKPRGVQVVMHRAIMDPLKEFRVIHLDGNGLNNQKANLRVCTRSVVAHRAGRRPRKNIGPDPVGRYVGVAWHVGFFRWVASIKIGQRKMHLGSYLKEEDAARAYDRAARVAYGDMANLNFRETHTGS